MLQGVVKQMVHPCTSNVSASAKCHWTQTGTINTLGDKCYKGYSALPIVNLVVTFVYDLPYALCGYWPVSLHMVSVCSYSVHKLMVSLRPQTFYPREISPVPNKHGTQWASRTGAGRCGGQNNNLNLPEIETNSSFVQPAA